MKYPCWIRGGLLFLAGGVATRAVAQSTLVPPVPAVPDAPREEVKRWRMFWEDIVSTGFTYDLNPRSKSLIVYPQISTIAYLGPEFGLNLRTPGVSYAAVGVAGNVYFTNPLIRLSLGQHIHNTFIEVGLIAFPAVGSDSDTDWPGPRVIPRFVFGTRF